MTQDPGYQEFLNTLRLGSVLRSGFAAFTLAVCLLLRSAGLLSFPLVPFLGIGLAELWLNHSWPPILRRLETIEQLKHLSLIHIVLDIAAASACLYLAGGLRVAFINLAYIFLILWAGFFISRRACYITAFASALAYATVLWLEYLEGFQPFATLAATRALPVGPFYLAVGLGHAAVLILVAYFGAKAAELLTATQQAQQASQTLKSDLDRTFRHLVRSEKLAATGELAAGMAHELYNPLTAIAGLAESALLSHRGAPPKILDSLAIIKTQAERAGAVVRRLLGFARPAEPQLVPCQLNQIVTESLAMVRYKADLHRITVELALDQHLLPIVGDPTQLQEVCVNLFLNAVQAMPKGGHLRIVTRAASPTHVEFQITDTGCGIPASHLARIFDPFFTTKLPGENTGLGLSITHGIVQRHCGTIDVRSRTNHGTTFTIRLPIDPTHAVQAEAGPAATVIDLAKSMANPSIMVVDDDTAVCGMLAQFLVDNGYQVTMATSGLEALALAANDPPDLVLLDLRMPGMDGVECLRQLKQGDATLPVVMVTAVDDEAVAARCLELGATEYLMKPVSLEYLRTILTVRLRRHRPLRKAQGE